uniref:Major facilitator superfamily (MFS) profile domain-containing protein n=1 Tax=Romanomermis culicivorax TaxID=13658 RepID=A0A915HLS0_ROMCU
MSENEKNLEANRSPPADVEEEIVAEAVIVPPDGGWGWVVVAASFLTNAVVDGIIFTAGQGFLPLWSKELTGDSVSMAAWVVSLLSGCYLLVGPVVSAVANIFGCRMTAIIGAVMAAAGFLFSMFANNIWFLYLSFGILGDCLHVEATIDVQYQ